MEAITMGLGLAVFVAGVYLYTKSAAEEPMGAATRKDAGAALTLRTRRVTLPDN